MAEADPTAAESDATPPPSSSEPTAADDSSGPGDWIPLILVPALIVVALFLVVAFFGGMLGSEASMAENLDRVLHGGANDRTQAAFNLGRQLSENSLDRAEGREERWEVEEGFLDELGRAWDAVPPDDHQIRLVLATALTQLDPESGLPKLRSILKLGDDQDPEGAVRIPAMFSLGANGSPDAAADLIPFLDHADPGMRRGAALALQKMGSPETRTALRRALNDEDFVVRAQAAISLSHMQDASGADLLRELAGLEAYEAERERSARRFTSGIDVQANRVRAVEALGRLNRPEDRDFLTSLADGEDADLLVREAAMRALRRNVAGEEVDGN